MFDLNSLRSFDGDWHGAGEVSPNPWGGAGPCRGRWSFRSDAAETFCVHDYVEERADGSVFKGHGVWCAEGRDLLWFWFDSYGYPPRTPSCGGWREKCLILEKSTPRGVGRSSWRIEDQQLHYRVEFRVANQPGFDLIMLGIFIRHS